MNDRTNQIWSISVNYSYVILFVMTNHIRHFKAFQLSLYLFIHEKLLTSMSCARRLIPNAMHWCSVQVASSTREYMYGDTVECYEY